MKTNPHSIVSEGLTKREHMAIEFTKALLTGRLIGDLNNDTIHFICKDAISISEELIKQLNAEQP